MGVWHRKKAIESVLTGACGVASRNVAIGASAAIVRADFDGRPETWLHEPGPSHPRPTLEEP